MKTFTVLLLAVCMATIAYGRSTDDEMVFVEETSSTYSQSATGGAASELPATPPARKGDVRIKSDVTVNGTVAARGISTRSLAVHGDASISTITISRTRATLVSADVVETGIIRSPTGTITIDGNLALSQGPVATSFLATDVTIDGVSQWRLVHHDNFQESADGWSEPVTSSCDGSSDKFLGGHCQFGGLKASRTFNNLPSHSHLRLVARYHFLDAWQGETAFATINGKYVWADTVAPVAADADAHIGLNMCGGDAADRKFSTPVDVSVAHNEDSVTIEFGSTLSRDPCVASWGVDDVMVYVR